MSKDSIKLSNSKFREYVEKKVRDTIRKYNLFSKNDKIGVAVSGGKDSTTCLYILKKLGYDVEGITIDAKIGNYTKQNIENLKKVCKENKIKLNIISFTEEFGMSLCYIRSVLQEKGHDYSSCMLCGILKRYLINKYSKQLKFDCLATGHNLDDEAQAFIMNVFRNDIILAKRQGPVSGTSKSIKFVKRVKPLYQISEKEVIRYSKLMKFPVNYERCPCSVNAYRRKYRNMLDEFEKEHPDIKYNIVRFHERLIAPLKKQEKNVEVNSCEICGEPTSTNMCKACQILVYLKTDKEKKLSC
jgi:uncharacterized protein (TIGR00269 family)